MLKQQLALPKSDWRQFKRELNQRCVASCAAAVGGLLTVPHFASCGFRLEALAHLVVAYSRGRRPISREHARRWLGDVLAKSRVADIEDPPEDVFVSNVHASRGNYRLFAGGWESAHSNLQQLMDSLPFHDHSKCWGALVESAESLLKLSDVIAERAGVERWQCPVFTPSSRRFTDFPDLPSLEFCVSFSARDLTALNVRTVDLERFILPKTAWFSLRQSQIRESELTRRPLIRVKGRIICVLPTAISVAVRYHMLAQATQLGFLDQIEAAFRAQQERLLFDSITPRIETVARSTPEFEHISVDGASASMAVIPLDIASVVLVSLFHDSLDDILKMGFNSTVRVPPAVQDKIFNHIAFLAKRSELVLGCLVFGGLGRTWSCSIPTLPSNVIILDTHLADLDLFASTNEASFLRLAKLIQHENWIQDQGVSIWNPSGILNLLAFWKSNQYSLVLDDLSLPADGDQLLIPNDCLRDLRIHAQVNRDHHGVKVPGADGSFMSVERRDPHPTFPSQAMRPVYISSEMLKAGHLVGVVKRQNLAVWVIGGQTELPKNLRQLVFGIWTALLEWLDRTADLLSQSDHGGTVVTRVSIYLENPNRWLRELSHGSQEMSLKPAIPIVKLRTPEIIVRLPPGFLRLLYQTENDAERALLAAVVSKLLMVIQKATEDESAARAQRYVEEIMHGKSGARMIHLFRSTLLVNSLPNPPSSTPRFIQPEDVSTVRIELGWRCVEQKQGGLIIKGDDVQTLLHRGVDEIWHLARKRLAKLDRLSVIMLAMNNLEAIHCERQQWRLTARALLALCESNEEALEIAAAQEDKRAIAAVSYRVIIEMAAPSGNRKDSRPAEWRDLDYLSALVAVLLELASHSDAIRGGLAKPEMHVTNARRIYFDREYMDSVFRPYSRSHHDSYYRNSASDYNEIRDVDIFNREPTTFARDFNRAFVDEFGMSIDNVLAVVRSLLRICDEQGQPVVHLSKCNLRQRMRHACRLPDEIVGNVMRFLTLPHRAQWDATPRGYEHRDWCPWRTRRRLAIALMPIVALGNQPDSDLVFSGRQLFFSVMNRLNGLNKGYFPSEHFTSSAMRKYWGDTRKRQGHAFASEVASVLEARGWRTETNVEMSSLEAPARLGDLGDIDVLAWHAESYRILVIECKSLIPRGSSYELVEELRDFRGKVNDRLGKHLARVEWLTENLEKLMQYRIPIKSRMQVLGLIVTNRQVPMRYTTNLSVLPSRFCTIEDLRETTLDDVKLWGT